MLTNQNWFLDCSRSFLVVFFQAYIDLQHSLVLFLKMMLTAAETSVLVVGILQMKPSLLETSAFASPV